MQDLQIFDMVVIGLTLILGLKGLFKGLTKEVFGIIGIIGAIFVASRVSHDVGSLIQPVLALDNETTIKLIGFIVALIGFWLVVYVLGLIVSKMFSASGLGIFDRIFGFIFGAAKVFLIFSVIAYAMYQVESFKKVINDKTSDSVVMPHLLSVGSIIIKIDHIAITEKIESTVDSVVETAKESTTTTKEDVQKAIEDTTNQVKEAIQEEIQKQVEQKVEETKENIVKEKTQEETK